jgi:transposase-like protein
MPRPSKYSPELRERAVRLVFDHGPEHPSQWAAIRSVAAKIGCAPEVLRRWVRQAERDAGGRPGLTTCRFSLASAVSFRDQRQKPLLSSVGCLVSGPTSHPRPRGDRQQF